MSYHPIAVLALGLAGIAPAVAGPVANGPTANGPTADHRVRIDHHSGPVDVHYSGEMIVAHRQVGTTAPGGRASTLRCHWTASLAVDRQATAASGTTARRSFVGDDMISGSRPGWCATNINAIDRNVAARTRDLDRHLETLAREDHDMLRAELDRLHPATRAG